MLFFPESPGSDVSAVKEALRSGLARTFEALPLLSGTVQLAHKAVQQGTLCVGAPWNSASDVFHARDLRHIKELNYADLRSRHFPVQALDKSTLLPMTDIEAREKAVMLVQVNFIKGGIIVGLCLHHSFTDGNGMAAVAKVWAACCKGEDRSLLVTPDMIERERLMRVGEGANLEDFPHLALLPMERPLREATITRGLLAWIHDTIFGWLMIRLHSWIMRKSSGRTVRGIPASSNMPIFFFSKSRLAELKDMASQKRCDEDRDSWISTNDALCSLLGCCILSTHRASGEHDGGQIEDKDTEIVTKRDREAVIAVVVNFRPFLEPPLPSDYIGNAFSLIRIALPLKTIEPTPSRITEIARLIRSDLKQLHPGYVDRLKSALQSVPDISRVVPRLPLSQPTIAITSWRNQSLYDLDWGNVIGSKIERVRDWRLEPTKNLVIIMPELKAPSFVGEDGGCEVAIALESGQIELLREDRLFNRFAQWRCNETISAPCSHWYMSFWYGWRRLVHYSPIKSTYHPAERRIDQS